MSATLAASRLPVAGASATCRQQQLRTAVQAVQAVRPLAASCSASFRRAALQPQRAPAAGRRQAVVRADGGGSSGTPKKNTEFGYSRKDVIIIGVGLIGGGYVMYYGLQATGMEPGIAGNWVQAVIFLGICVGWIGSYLYRVATKQMTYAQQLDDYEEAVMQKRLEEMPDGEMERMMAEIEAEKEKAKQGKK